MEGGEFFAHSPLSPRGERPAGDVVIENHMIISTHSPRVGRDKELDVEIKQHRKIQPTLPAWGETAVDLGVGHGKAISTHSPRVGRDIRLPDGEKKVY